MGGGRDAGPDVARDERGRNADLYVHRIAEGDLSLLCGASRRRDARIRRHGVTLGDLGGYGGAPHIGNNVLIGAGAKILGEVEIGDSCRIGANAVVLASIPARHIAVGVPAVVKPTAA